MAQSEDTELRDLVIEALENNGSLAKVRALLRANIFLAFEDERDNVKQNANLDNILKMSEGILSLSIVHEFLEFCNLKNTLFVYMSESRQGKEYKYEGKKVLTDKINGIEQDSKEPVLLTLLKTLLKLQSSTESNDPTKYDEKHDSNYKEEQNCTYIVHEDSQSSTTTSNSDNSSDEKNKLQLRLPLEHSDTDTSSDSTRDKSGSEYIPNAFLPSKNGNILQYSNEQDTNKENIEYDKKQNKSELQVNSKINTSSSDSTSYIDIRSLNVSNKLLNISDLSKKEEKIDKTEQKSGVLDKSPTLSNISSVSHKNINVDKISPNKSNTGSVKSDSDSGAEYSYDFSSSPKKKESEQWMKSSQHGISPRKILQENQNLSPQSSRSSISISDVADLLSDRSSTKNGGLMSKVNSSYKNADSSKLSDHSDELTESPIPSLSNLSLDIHSD